MRRAWAAAIAVPLLAWVLTAGQPQTLVTAFLPIPPILFGVGLVLAILFDKPREAVRRALGAVPDWRFLTYLMALALALMLMAAFLVHERVPHVTDEAAYLFQAQAFASGSWGPSAENAEFFRPHFFYLHDADAATLTSLFQPGWPLVLMLGIWLGVPWLVNPLVSVLLLIPAYRLGVRVAGREAARWGLLLLVLSPFYFFMGASFMSHPLAALLSLIALERALAFAAVPRARDAALIGAAIGLLALVRVYNAFLLGLVVLPWLAWRVHRHGECGAWRRLLWLPAFAFVGLGLQLGYNQLTTDSPTTFPQDVYFSRTEATPTCHRLGFGTDIGCSYEHGKDAKFADGYGPLNALHTTALRLSSLALNLHGTPWLLVLMLVPAFLFRRARAPLVPLYAFIASLILGYALFYYHGNCYGPRFYFEALPLITLLGAAGFVELTTAASKLATRHPRLGALPAAPLRALLFALLVFALGYMTPALCKAYQKFRGQNSNLRLVVERAGITRGFVLIPGDDVTYVQAAGFIAVPDEATRHIRFAQHFGPSSVNLQLMHPADPFYRFQSTSNYLIALAPVSFAGAWHVAMEDKWPLAEERACHAEPSYFSRFALDDDRTRSQEVGLYVTAQAGASFEFPLDVPAAGAYLLSQSTLTGGASGAWELRADGLLLGRFDGRAKSVSERFHLAAWTTERPVTLSHGRHRVEWRLVAPAPFAARTGLPLGGLTLRRVPDGLEAPLPELRDLGHAILGHMTPFVDGVERPHVPLWPPHLFDF